MVKIILYLFIVGSTEPSATIEFVNPRPLEFCEAMRERLAQETIQAFASIGVPLDAKSECRPVGSA